MPFGFLVFCFQEIYLIMKGKGDRLLILDGNMKLSKLDLTQANRGSNADKL